MTHAIESSGHDHVRRRGVKICILLATGCAPIFLFPGDAFAVSNGTSTGITVESVSSYAFYSGGSTENDTIENLEGEGFWNAMTANGTGFTQQHHWEDNNVFDTDFYDPDLTGSPLDDDAFNFDSPGTAIAWAFGHGLCKDFEVAPCLSDSDCGPGAYCPGGGPLENGQTRTCLKETRHALVTSSSASVHGNLVVYGSDYDGAMTKNLAFGEDPASGSWDGAGTNGGDNVVFFTNSCGFRRPYLVQNTAWMFAGMHALFFNMPTKAFRERDGVQAFSDTTQWGARGANAAATILANQYAPMYAAWLNPTQVNNSYGLTTGVPTTDPNTGLVGEGANVMMSVDVSFAAAQWRTQSESWAGARLESNDPVGYGYWSYHALCNYDCNTYGW